MRPKSILSSLLLGVGALGLSASAFAVEPETNTNMGTRANVKAAAATASANFTRARRMRLNDSGNRVSSLPRETIWLLQTTLQNEGLYKGAVDGIEGPQTRLAVRQYQQKRKLEVTGQWDNETLWQLGVGTPDTTMQPVSGTGTKSLDKSPSENTPSNMKAPSGTLVQP